MVRSGELGIGVAWQFRFVGSRCAMLGCVSAVMSWFVLVGCGVVGYVMARQLRYGMFL